MRLLKLDEHGQLSLTADFQDKVPPYAILSHTWGEEKDEVNINDLKHGLHDGKAGYSKIRFCGEQARKDKLEYFWVDTCCINKDNLTELSEAITSMFRWYRDAAKCYVYLTDVSTRSKDEDHDKRMWKLSFRKSRWFTRGWTLQELLAPTSVDFFSVEGERLGSRETLQQKIQEITGIPAAALQGRPLSQFSHEERLRWASHRNTTKIEDKAYCLLGIFGVFMPLMYGEKENAFARLRREIDQSPQGSQSFTASAADVVDAAMLDFRETLSVKDAARFQCFTNLEKLRESIQNHCTELPNKQKTTALSTRLLRATSSFDPVFQMMHLMQKYRPEWLEFSLGAIHMVFVSSTRYTTLLGKFVNMLQTMAERIPYYTEYLKLLSEAKQKPKASAHPALDDHSRLAVALSYVYADLIGFCRSACKIFNGRDDDLLSHAAPIQDLMWTPFDTRFGNILDRLAEHKDIFNIEIQLQRDRDQLSHYGNMDSGSAAQQIVDAVKEIQIRIHEMEGKASQRFNQFMRSITEPQSSSRLDRKARSQKEEEVKRSRIHDIRNWINMSQYTRAFDRACSIRHPETSTWVTRMPEYAEWQGSDLSGKKVDPDSGVAMQPISFEKRVLSIQAKPGYGKTILSSFIIEDLEISAPSHSEPQFERRNVAFFHFTTGQSSSLEPEQAFRAILTQLLDQNADNRNLIDLLSVLMDSTGSNHGSASDREVNEAFALFVRLLSNCYFIFDGIDECLRPNDFLHLLYDHCSESCSRVLLLHRPNLQLPESWNGCRKVLLNRTQNLADITQVVSEEVKRLSERSEILAELPEAEVTETIALRANGMFLWAKLILQYLRCPALTYAERLKCIQETAIVQGIEELYGRILKQVDTKYREEKELVFKMLRTIAVAVRPLTLSEIKYALAIRIGHVTSTANQIADFESSWVFFAGHLLEQRDDETIGFIHSSVLEYLQSTETSDMAYHVHPGSCHADLSNACLSYLIHDMPASMLSGHSGQKASADHLRKAFPFIDYALSWVKHGELCMDHTSPSTGKFSGLRPFTALVSTIGLLTSRKFVATAWIEASWTFGIQPSLKKLWEKLRVMLLIPADIGPQPRKHLQQLGEFAKDLEILAQEWSHVLKFYPNEIWNDSITAFSKSCFWYQTEETRVTKFDFHGFSSSAGLDEIADDAQLVIGSQVSVDGRDLGLISLIPPENYVRFIRHYAAKAEDPLSSINAHLRASVLSSSAKLFCRGWKARYKAWELLNKSILFDLQIDLPPEQIWNILDQSFKSQYPWRFTFPIAFSSDLGRVVILHTISQISVTGPDTNGSYTYSCHTQSLSSTPTQLSNESDPEFYTILEPFFSPDGGCAAFVESRVPADRHMSATIPSRVLSVWRDFSDPTAQYPEMEPNFVLLGRHLVNNAASRHLKDFKSCIAFHPHLPFIAFPQWGRTSLWYLQKNVLPDLVANYSLQALRFTTGVHLEGITTEHAYYDTDSVAENSDGDGWLEDQTVLLSIAHVMSKYSTQPEVAQYLSDYLSQHSSMTSSELPSLSNFAPTSKDSRSTSLTKPQHLSSPVARPERKGSCQIFLPSMQTSSATYLTSIPPTEAAYRMIWNKGSQESYSILDTPEKHLPSLIERRKRDTPGLESHEQDRQDPVLNTESSSLIKYRHDES